MLCASSSFKFLPKEFQNEVSVGDREYFDTFITQKDIQQIASWGCDHIRLAFDYIILEPEGKPFTYDDKGFANKKSM